MLPAPTQTGNAYTVLLYRALESVGLRYVQIPYSLRYVLTHGPRERFHYVHFHWPEVFFDLRPRAPQRLFGLKGYLYLHALWFLLELRGYRLVWTVHEVDVHDVTQLRWAHALSRRLLWALSDVVFTHSAAVRADAERRWGRKRHVYTIPHGAYAGAYRDDVTREAARARLGIPDSAHVFVFFGNMRPYKGVDVLIDAFRALHARNPDAHLILAGRPYDDAYASAIRASVRDLPRVHLALGFVPDDDVQIYLRAADCFVAPYRYVETSGALFLALAFQLPVIMTAQGNVPELESLGVGWFLRDAAEVRDAMQRFLDLPAGERARMREAAHAVARQHAWESLAPRYREAFDAVESRRTRTAASEVAAAGRER
jgi:glycosyltransferase involved in cell wall biosynthesis